MKAYIFKTKHAIAKMKGAPCHWRASSFKRHAPNRGFIGRNRPVALASGMSLIEVLAAIAVLAIGISAILGLQTATSLTSSRSNFQSMATFLVESQVEYLKALGSNSVQFVSQDSQKLTLSGLACNNPVVEPCVFTRTVTVKDLAPTTVSAAVMVKVEWDGGAVVHDTVISRVGF